MNIGLTARLVGASSVRFMADHPEMKLCSVWEPWNKLQPNGPGPLAEASLAALGTSIADAHDKGYQLIIRTPAGASAPTWLENAQRPVKFIDLISNDPNPQYSGRRYHLPVPWDANLASYDTDFTARKTEWAKGPCPRDPSHPRSTHIHSWPLALPTEDGTEMTWGYGKEETNRTHNTAAWNRISTVAERQQRLLDAWWQSIVRFLAADPNWRCSLAGGHLMEDGLRGANTIIDRLAALPEKDRKRVILMITNLSTAEKWPVSQKNLANWLDRGIQIGLSVGLQSAGTAILAIDDFEGFKSGVEYALKRYGKAISYFEPQPSRIGANSREYAYMLDVQRRMQPTAPPGTPAVVPHINATVEVAGAGATELIVSRGEEVWRAPVGPIQLEDVTAGETITVRGRNAGGDGPPTTITL